jgi:hypothetical protein
MNNDLADGGGPHNRRCTGLSACIAISNSDFTSSKPIISSNKDRFLPKGHFNNIK